MKFHLKVADPFLDLLPPSIESEYSNKLRESPTLADLDIMSTTQDSMIGEASSCAGFERMTAQLHQICSDEFDSYELEDCHTWIRFIYESRRAAFKLKHKDKNFSFPDCHAVYLIIVASNEKGQEQICGGAVAEIYLEARSAMISYIVTCPEFRGQKLGKKMVEYIALHMNSICKAYSSNHEPLACLLVDVAQHRDAENDEEKKLAKERQIIWSKLGFSPIDFDMKYPGYLSQARYNVGVYRGSFSSKNTCLKNKDKENGNENENDDAGNEGDEQEQHQKIFLESKTLLQFLLIMYTSVHEDESELVRGIPFEKHMEPAYKLFDFELRDDEILKKKIEKTNHELIEMFKEFEEEMLVDDKFWR